MSELERRLRAYGAAIEFPHRDFWPEVAPRLARRPSHRRARILVALAMSVLAASAAVAIAPARAALLELLGFDGVTVVRVERLPPIASAASVELGRRTTLVDAQAAVPFQLRLPAGQDPDEVYVGRDRPPAVAVIYGTRTRPRVLLSQFRPCCGRDTLRKEVPPGVRVEELTVEGSPGLWIQGRHVMRSGGRARIAGSTLLWKHDGIVYRLEAGIDRDEALAFARSLVPVAR